LVVIAILAVLAAVTVVVINPAELMARARDTERLTELNSIHRNLGLFLATAPSPTLGLANRVYISLPDTSPTCATWTGLPPLPTGWSYVCSTPANFRRTDGTGWIPVNFDASAGGSPFAVLSIDPVNNVSHYYTYVTGGSWNLTALMESSHESTLRPAVNDGGAMPGVLEIGTNPRLGPFTRDRGLVGFWRFEEGTGTTTADSSGNANTGTLLHGPTWQPPANCKQGRCLRFDGVDDNVNVGNASILSSSRNETTVMAWFRLNGWSPSWEFVTHGGAGGTAFGVDLGKHFRVAMSIGGTRHHLPSLNRGTLLGTWYHIASTYSATTRTVKFYVDGVAMGSDVIPGGSLETGGNTIIAAGEGFFVNGFIDEVRIYNRALSPAEISAIFNATR
jgi:hypothetical protein